VADPSAITSFYPKNRSIYNYLGLAPLPHESDSNQSSYFPLVDRGTVVLLIIVPLIIVLLCIVLISLILIHGFLLPCYIC